jgi:transposase
MKTKSNQATLATTTSNREALPIKPIADDGVLYMAFELSAKEWKIAITDGRPQMRMVTVRSGNLEGLKEEVKRAKKKFGLNPDCRVLSCYEAGRDGFWLHRFLVIIGVENAVVDSASIEVNRRKRRAKTDRLDARKLVTMLMRYHGGESKLWSVVRVPSVQDEDARQLHRELEQLKRQSVGHRTRIGALLWTQGVSISVGKCFIERLEQARQFNGDKLPAGLISRIKREYEILLTVQSHISKIEAERRKLLKESKTERINKVNRLKSLRGVGINGAWLLVMEFFGWRVFDNRKQVGSAAGLTGTPYDSGGGDREQGISKAGNRRIRWMMDELAWGWLRFQPDSALTRWYNEKYARGNSRLRRIGITALARRLLIELWRFVEHGIVTQGAVLKTV